jgi:hypothetical protein
MGDVSDQGVPAAEKSGYLYKILNRIINFVASQLFITIIFTLAKNLCRESPSWAKRLPLFSVMPFRAGCESKLPPFDIVPKKPGLWPIG